jgi:hypothetical protein
MIATQFACHRLVKLGSFFRHADKTFIPLVRLKLWTRVVEEIVVSGAPGINEPSACFASKRKNERGAAE